MNMTVLENKSVRRVLITGAAGGIGSAAADYLADQGILVTGLSLEGPFSEGCERRVIGDATSPDDVSACLEDVDAVVHLAAIPHPSQGTPYAVYRTNVNATFNVLAEAGARGVKRVVVASSINASGISFNRHRMMPAYFPLDEEIPPDIEDAYSLSKRSDELTAKMASRRWDIDVVSLRFPLVKDQAALRRIAREDRADPTRTVREGWSYLDIRDAARAIHLALIRPVTGAVVIGLSAKDTLMDRPTEELLSEYARDVPVRKAIPGFGAAIDTRLAQTVLGFEAEYSIHHESADSSPLTELEGGLDA
jgi:nucleoside-diphosphate-sugar epimerase